MTARRLAQLRRQVRNGEFPDDLIAELRTVVERLVRLRLLPPSFAPYGQWDEEAAKEIFSSLVYRASSRSRAYAVDP